MRHFRRHADTLPERWMRMDGFADIYGVCTHFNVSGWRTHIDSMSLRGDSVHYEDSAHQFERG